MTTTPQEMQLLSAIGEGQSSLNGNCVVYIDALIARGLVAGVRLGYIELRLTPAGRQALAQAEAKAQKTSHMYNRRRSDQQG